MKRIKILSLAAALCLSFAAVEAAPGWTFYACFTYFSAAPCRDVFQDPSGALWVCDLCGTTKKPSSRSCTPLTGSGLWCS